MADYSDAYYTWDDLRKAKESAYVAGWEEAKAEETVEVDKNVGTEDPRSEYAKGQEDGYDLGVAAEKAHWNEWLFGVIGNAIKDMA